jgi:3-dehydroquinate dehydratase-2
MTPRIHVLNGPNLNLLGTREPEVFGTLTLDEVEAACRDTAERHGLEMIFRQTNAEHRMIEWLHDARYGAGVVIAPSAFCYQSLPVVDAVKMCTCPVIELHIENIHRREPWRSKSLLSGVCTAHLTGFGTYGYILAIEHLAHLLRSRSG